jgi:tRNA dimethylallyltransferase
VQSRLAAEARYRFVPVALVPTDREALHRRIERRFEAMLAAGPLDELVSLRLKYALSPELTAMRCVGDRQGWEHLEGKHDLASLRDRGVYATRRLAERQLT